MTLKQIELNIMPITANHLWNRATGTKTVLMLNIFKTIFPDTDFAYYYYLLVCIFYFIILSHLLICHNKPFQHIGEKVTLFPNRNGLRKKPKLII